MRGWDLAGGCARLVAEDESITSLFLFVWAVGMQCVILDVMRCLGAQGGAARGAAGRSVNLDFQYKDLFPFARLSERRITK